MVLGLDVGFAQLICSGCLFMYSIGFSSTPYTLPDDCPRAFAPGLVGHRLSHVPSSCRYTSSGCWHEYTLTISPLVLSHRWSGCTMTGHGVCVSPVINHLTTVIVPMRVSRVIVPQNKVRTMVRVFTCLFSFGLCVLFGLGCVCVHLASRGLAPPAHRLAVTIRVGGVGPPPPTFSQKKRSFHLIRKNEALLVLKI